MEKEVPTRSEFMDWKHSPVTKAIYEDLNTRILALQAELGQTAGADPLQDRFVVGMIRAYKNLWDIEWEEVANA